MTKSKTRSQACNLCRSKKSKCDMKDIYPCSNCKKNAVACVRPSLDKRTVRITSERTKLLEERLNLLELERVKFNTSQRKIFDLADKIGSFSQQIKLLNGDHFDNSNPIPESTVSPQLIPSFETRPVSSSLGEVGAGSVSVYGPSSLFDSEPVEGLSQDVIDFKSRNHDPAILKWLKFFFIWLYPDVNHFIYREAFLLEFFHPRSSPCYCSEELVLAVCAMGSRVSGEKDAADTSLAFYAKAREMSLTKMEKPSLPLLQSFLLLGLYDIYNCRNNSGWMLTGIGLRMGSNIGFHLDPQNWLLDSDECNIGIRSRIFWGAYLVDHLTALFLGRACALKIQEVSIKETINLPDMSWIDEFTYHRPNETARILQISDPLKACVQLMNIAENMLQQVFNDPKNLQTKIDMVVNYNQEIFTWRANLPVWAQWNIHTLEIDGDNPSKITMWLLYYMIVLSLNRPFISQSRRDYSIFRNSSKICDDAIYDFYIIISAILKAHGQLHCSFLVVYMCILSVTAILASHERLIKDCGENQMKSQFLTFMHTLKSCSSIWGLSEKAYLLINERVSDRLKIDVEFEIQKSEILKTYGGIDIENLALQGELQTDSSKEPGESLGWENLLHDCVFNF